MGVKIYDFVFSQSGLTGLTTTIGESYTKAGKVGTTKDLLANSIAGAPGVVADTYMPTPATENVVAKVAFDVPITAPIDEVDTAVTLMGTAGICKEIALGDKVDDWWFYDITVEKDLTLT
jgi:hypothetical protein